MDLSVSCNAVCGAEKVSLKSSEYRKVIKPLLERRRRARINSCLDELKALIMESSENENADASKLEKADILELTVQHLRNLRRTSRHHAGVTYGVTTTAPLVEDKFRAGFAECAQEVSAFLSSVNGVDHGSKCRLLSHLANRIPPSTPSLYTGENPTPPPSPILSPEYPMTPVDSPVFVNYSDYVWHKREESPAVVSPKDIHERRRSSASYHPYVTQYDKINGDNQRCWRPW